MTCQYCGSQLPAGAAECPVCGEAVSYYGNASANQQSYSGQAAYAASAAPTQQYGSQQAQAYSYGSQNSYSGASAQQYSAASYSQMNGYGSPQGSYSSASGQQYSSAAQSSPSNGYGAQGGYSGSYAQQYSSASPYSQLSGYGAQGYYSNTPGQQYSSASPMNAYGAQMYGMQSAAQSNGYGLQQYPGQNLSQGEPSILSPFEEAGKTMRSLVVSPVFIIGIILACLSMILGATIAFSDGSVLESHYEGSVDYDELYNEFSNEYELDDSFDSAFSGGDAMEYLVEDVGGIGSLDSIVGAMSDIGRSPLSAVPILFTNICSFGDKINALPYLLMIIGFWVTLGSIASRGSAPFSTGGLTCIKVGLVFRTVFSCILGGLTILALLLTTILGSSILSALDSLAGEIGAGVMLIVLAVFITYFVLRCIYYAKQTKSLNMVRTTASQGIFNLNISTYVIFWNFFLAVLHLATAIYFYRTPLLLVRHLANAGALVLISVSMIQYRNSSMSYRGTSIPVHL